MILGAFSKKKKKEMWIKERKNVAREVGFIYQR